MLGELFLYDDVNTNELEALKDEVRDFCVLATQDIDNTDLKLDENGYVIIPEGSLLHSTRYRDGEEAKMESIAKYGNLTKEFFSLKDEGRTHYHVEYYRTNKDTNSHEFIEELKKKNPNVEPNTVSYLILSSPCVTEVLKGNSLDKNSSTIEDIRLLIKGAIRYHVDEIKENTFAAIPIGIPSNCFSALIVTKELEQNEEKMNHLKEFFNRLPIINEEGKIIYQPKKDEING